MYVEEINCILTESRANDQEAGSLSSSEIEIVKSSDISKDKIIKLDDDTVFQFDCIVDDDYLILKLSEIDAVAPYTYCINKTLKQMQDIHKMFKSCDNLDEVKSHIDKLFKNDKIKLSQIKDEEIIFEFKAYFISYEDDFQIVAERKMVNNKDSMLLKLYQIQKQELKVIKEIETYIKKNDFKKNELLNQIKEIKEKYENKK